MVKVDHLPSAIEEIWRVEIEPYLEEVFFDRWEQFDSFRWEKVEAQLTW
jgi:5-methylcytosine-specific restriction enzyme B